jgi:hypothetical protein
MSLCFRGSCFAVVAVGVVACGDGGGTHERTGQSGAALDSAVDGQIDRQEVIDRSQSWIDEQVPYSQSDYHQNQFGSYRQDCSGFVSMAWHLGTSRTTWTLWDVSTTISQDDLQAGDALLKDADGTDHVALFLRWAGTGSPVVREEYDYGQVAEERTWESLRGFTPVRYNNIGGAAPSAGAPGGAPGATSGGGTSCPGGQGTTVGAIDAEYQALGGCGSFLGVPITDEQGTPDGVGRYSVFQNGSIYWSPPTDAHEVHGMIRDKWSDTGWEAGILGYPITDETPTPDGVGRYNVFERGSIYWTPALGAHEVHGRIRDEWKVLGWEAGSLGYPISDEYATSDGRANDFEHGSILWHASTDTFTVAPSNGASTR